MRFFRDHRRVFVVKMPKIASSLLLATAVGLVLVSCAGQSKPIQDQSMVGERQQLLAREQRPQSKTKTLAERLLERAETQFSAGNMFEPESLNAYDLYRAVQSIEPENKSAEAGLQAILLAETERARQSLAKSRTTEARAILGRLQERFSPSPMLARLSNEIQRSSRPRKNAAVAKAQREQALEQIRLDEAALKSKDEELVAQLQSIAVRLQGSDEGVLIYARSDAQGRWIYQQMRKAVPEYRIRGDLRIGPPRVKILPPFE